jgi:hypothetical protein
VVIGGDYRTVQHDAAGLDFPASGGDGGGFLRLEQRKRLGDRLSPRAASSTPERDAWPDRTTPR